MGLAELNSLNMNDALATLRPLMFFVVGVAIYSIFIFNFYRFLGRKDIFELDLEGLEKSKDRTSRMVWHFFAYIAKYLIFFPVVAFAWFAILAVLLTFLSKSGGMESILLVAMAVLSAVRVAAYYNEDLSRDLAKILPFALLGIFLIDLSYFSLASSLRSVIEVFYTWQTIVYYLAFVILLEFALRMSSPIFQGLFSGGKSKTQKSLPVLDPSIPVEG